MNNPRDFNRLATQPDHFHELSLPDRNHLSIYTKPEILEAELQRIFYRTWVYIGHDSEIPKAGDYKSTYIGDIPVLMTRNKQQQINVVINRCMHRGLTVCPEEYGNSRYFTCPYHGWTYDMDGTLVEVGAPAGYTEGEIDKSELGLRAVPRVGSYRGFVFASLSPTGRSLDEHLGRAKPHIDNYVDRSPLGTITAGKSGVYKYDYDGNWKIQLEGSVEGYHVFFTHASFLEIAKKKNPGLAEQFNNPDMRGIDLGNGHNIIEVFRLPRELVNQVYPEGFRKQIIERVGEEGMYDILGTTKNLVLFPNMALLEHQIRVIRPLGAAKTQVDSYHTLLDGAPEAVNIQRVRGHEKFYGPSGFGGPDDIEMFNRMQEGYKATMIEWVYINRGYLAETTNEHGERIGRPDHETVQRAPYYEWRKLMAEV